MEYILNSEGVKTTQPAPTKATGNDYRGYYADVDGDGTVDGIIYADLNKSVSGQWYYGPYSYEKQTGLKECVISEGKYTEGKFGEKEIIRIKFGSRGNARFYVMALSDFRSGSFETGNGACGNGVDCTEGTYYWYNNATGHMDPKITQDEFGTGSNNTKLMIKKWKAAGTNEGYSNSPQNNQDIWKHIQGEYAKGWYIPSRGECGAFADYFKQRTENGLTHNYESGSYVANSGNYKNLYGLSGWYWSSSQYDASSAWRAHFTSGTILSNGVNFDYYVRLGATF